MARQRPDERGHQRHVHHRDVIHDQQVAREWIGLTTLKPPLPGSASSKRWMVLASNSGLLPRRVLTGIIDSAVVPTARLTEVFRQAAQSRIVVNAHRINQGQMPELNLQPKEVSDFYLVEADEPDDAARKIIELVQNRIPARFGLDPIREVQVLCPMNRGRLAARALNLDLQAALNGDQSKPSAVRFGCSFRSGDKVMQTINDYDKDVFNGDLGFVQ